MPASTHPLYFLSFKPCAVSLAVRKDAARRRDILSRVNIVKRIKIGGRWKMFSIPHNAKGNYDWNAIADGRYYVEWYAGGTRRRVSPWVGHWSGSPSDSRALKPVVQDAPAPNSQ